MDPHQYYFPEQYQCLSEIAETFTENARYVLADGAREGITDTAKVSPAINLSDRACNKPMV